MDKIKTESKPETRGRKSKYYPGMADILLEKMTDGLSFEACCGFLEISKETGYKYIKAYPEFREARELGETRGQLFWEKAAISGMWSDKDSKFNSTVFIFMMKNRFNWRDKKEIMDNRTGGITDPYKDHSINQIDAEIATLMGRLGVALPHGPKKV